jgi:hypothetical protein
MMCSKQHVTRFEAGDRVKVRGREAWGIVYLSHIDSGSVAIVDLGRKGEREVPVSNLILHEKGQQRQQPRATGFLRLRTKRRW